MLLLLKLNISWRARLPWMITIPSWYVCWSKTRLGSKMESKKGQFFQFTLKHRHYFFLSRESKTNIKWTDPTSASSQQHVVPKQFRHGPSPDLKFLHSKSFNCRHATSCMERSPLDFCKNRDPPMWCKNGETRCFHESKGPHHLWVNPAVAFLHPFQRADQWTPWGWQLIHMSDSWITIRYKHPWVTMLNWGDSFTECQLRN